MRQARYGSHVRLKRFVYPCASDICCYQPLDMNQPEPTCRQVPPPVQQVMLTLLAVLGCLIRDANLEGGEGGREGGFAILRKHAP